MKKIFFLILIFISGFALVNANNLVDDSTVVFMPNWKKGDTNNFLIKNIQRKYNADKIVSESLETKNYLLLLLTLIPTII